MSPVFGLSLRSIANRRLSVALTVLAVALAVALLLAAWPVPTRLDRAAWLSRLSRTSYALFLVHFPVFLLMAAAFAWWWPAADGNWVARIAIAWVASMIAADLFERFVERPLMARSGRRARSGSESRAAPT